MRQTAILLGTFLLGSAGFVLTISNDRTQAATQSMKVLWAGHQVVFGETRVPFRGTLQTRTDTFVLAEVVQNERQITLKQIGCDTIIRDIAGVSVKIPVGALKRMPPVRFRLLRDQQRLSSKPWTVGWRGEDIDRDGHPGMSVKVDAPLCNGLLHVASQTISQAEGTVTSDGMRGLISVRVKQQILGADSWCLRWFAKDSDEQQKGLFAYRHVSNQSTCDSLLNQGWPIRADSGRISADKKRKN